MSELGLFWAKNKHTSKNLHKKYSEQKNPPRWWKLRRMAVCWRWIANLSPHEDKMTYLAVRTPLACLKIWEMDVRWPWGVVYKNRSRNRTTKKQLPGPNNMVGISFKLTEKTRLPLNWWNKLPNRGIKGRFFSFLMSDVSCSFLHFIFTLQITLWNPQERWRNRKWESTQYIIHETTELNLSAGKRKPAGGMPAKEQREEMARKCRGKRSQVRPFLDERNQQKS